DPLVLSREALPLQMPAIGRFHCGDASRREWQALQEDVARRLLGQPQPERSGLSGADHGRFCRVERGPSFSGDPLESTIKETETRRSPTGTSAPQVMTVTWWS